MCVCVCIYIYIYIYIYMHRSVTLGLVLLAELSPWRILIEEAWRKQLYVVLFFAHTIFIYELLIPDNSASRTTAVNQIIC